MPKNSLPPPSRRPGRKKTGRVRLHIMVAPEIARYLEGSSRRDSRTVSAQVEVIVRREMVAAP